MVVLTTPSSLSQAVKVVKTNKRGRPDENPKKNKTKTFLFFRCKRILITKFLKLAIISHIPLLMVV